MRHRESKRMGRQLEETALYDANLIILAERELAAFCQSNARDVWPETAKVFTADWVNTLESLNGPARTGASDFRRITTSFSSRPSLSKNSSDRA
jgi:hypothetical protein